MRKKENRADKKKPSPIDKITEALELPPVFSKNSARMEILGNREAIIDGVAGVIEYDENIIRLSVGKKEIQFCGQDLELRALSANEAVVAGDIHLIEFV